MTWDEELRMEEMIDEMHAKYVHVGPRRIFAGIHSKAPGQRWICWVPQYLRGPVGELPL